MVIIVRKDATAMLVVVEGGTATFTIVKEGGDSDAERNNSGTPDTGPPFLPRVYWR